MDNLVSLGDEEDEEAIGARNRMKLLPPYNERAEIPQEAYPMAGYFPAEERGPVDESIKVPNFLFESAYAKSRYSHTKSKELKRLAGYFECLFRFRTKVGNFVAAPTDVVRLLGIGDTVLADSLLKRFMEPQPLNFGGGWGRSKMLKDKLVINMLIVALACEGFRFTNAVIEAIANDLKVETKSILPMLMKMGCHWKKEEGEKFLALTVPLIFPEEKKRPRRSRA